MTRSKSFIQPAIAAAVVAAFFAIAPYHVAHAQRTSLSDIDRKVDDIQGTLGPMPGDPDLNIQQQIDALNQQNELILAALCALPNPPVGVHCNKIVFVTSTTSNGDLGGLGGADATCNSLAKAAGLPGTYLAWLSNILSSPSTRFNKSTAPYVLVDGTIVASNYQDLTDGQLLNPINKTENGDIPGSLSAWTGTLPDGTLSAVAMTCGNWFFTNASGLVGSAGITTEAWTEANDGVCTASQVRLYCFQQ